MKTDILTGKLEFQSLRPCDLGNFTKEDAKKYFDNSFELNESLFTAIKDDEYFYRCPDRLRLPLIFYYGHTAAVYVNKLVLGGLIDPHERINNKLETDFETGVDEMSWDDIEHYRMGGSYQWPSLAETKIFREKVKELIHKVIDRTPLILPVKWDSPWWALFLAFEHERIHIETSSVLIRQLPIEMLSKPIDWKYAPFEKDIKNKLKASNSLICIPETEVILGKDIDFPSFGWDNEYGRVKCKVSEFEASKFKITNEEFLEFVNAKGYQNKNYWTKEGWNWLQFRKANHPPFWVCPYECKSGCGVSLSSYSHCQKKNFTQDELKSFEEYKSGSISTNTEGIRNEFPYKLRLMYDVVPMPYNWPVEINYHEAKAYCIWKGSDYRLLSEAEHHAIRDTEVFNLDSSSDLIYQDSFQGNNNLTFGSSTAVDYYPANTKGFHDVFGNVWEWCEDHFNGLPGFKTTFMYDDFSTPCFDGRHNIIMGGSWISTGDEASKYARFMFRRHFLQHCGFRLARSVPKHDGSKSNPQFRFVSNTVYVSGLGFPENQIALDESKLVIIYYPTENKQYKYDTPGDALDNEIVKEYGNKSEWFQPFINEIKELMNDFQINKKTATHLGSSTGRITFTLAKEFEKVIAIDYCGQFIDLCTQMQSKMEQTINSNKNLNLDIDLKDNHLMSRVTFKQMTWLSNEIPAGDLVLFTMIDRVMNPCAWLYRFRELVKKDGLLIILSENGVWKSEKIKEVIGKNFKLVNEKNILHNQYLFSTWKLETKNLLS